MVDYSSLPQALTRDEVYQQQYTRFFETHVRTGVTDGLLQSVKAQDVIDFAAAKNGSLPDIIFSDNALAAFKDNATIIADFAKKVGAANLIFTNEGTWIIPPKMRSESPEYKKYLTHDYQGGNTVGTAAITLAQNQPIPVYENGRQIGGFENGDDHGYLSIVDRRTGKIYELHQTFLENSDDPAFRPGFAGINNAFPKSSAEIMEILKNPDTKLDGVGMLTGKETGAVGYACEYTPNIDVAFNWNNGVPGSNFNYVPIAAIEFKLTEQQLDALLFDRELAAREGGIKAAPGSPAKQNEPGYIPAARDAFYPDGTPRYIVAHEVVTKDGTETIFKNAYPGMPGELPAEAIRVKEYETVVRPENMQVVCPYNHLGGSKSGFEAASNCFKAVCDVLDGVAASGVESASVRSTIHATHVNEAGLGRMLARNLLIGGQTQRLHLNGPVDGDVTVRTQSINGGGTYNVYDFANTKNAALRSIGGLREVIFSNETITGKAIAQIATLREEAALNSERPSADKLVLFPVGALVNILKALITSFMALSRGSQRFLIQRSGIRLVSLES